MPEVYVYAVEGRTIDQKRSLVKDITEAVVRNFKVTPEAVMVQIMESPKDSKAKGGFLFSDRPPG
jgi:4-oxalocrotonate tautomerase